MSVAEYGGGVGGLITLIEESWWSPLDNVLKFDLIISFKSTKNTDFKLGPCKQVFEIFVNNYNTIIIEDD